MTCSPTRSTRETICVLAWSSWTTASTTPASAEHRRQLEEKAERNDVRVHVVTQAERHRHRALRGPHPARPLRRGVPGHRAGPVRDRGDRDPDRSGQRRPSIPLGGSGMSRLGDGWSRLPTPCATTPGDRRPRSRQLLGVEPDGKPAGRAVDGRARVGAVGAAVGGVAVRPGLVRRPLTFWVRRRPSGSTGRFPFLAKILAAAQPLSIQAHPVARSRPSTGTSATRRPGSRATRPTATTRTPGRSRRS